MWQNGKKAAIPERENNVRNKKSTGESFCEDHFVPVPESICFGLKNKTGELSIQFYVIYIHIYMYGFSNFCKNEYLIAV